MATYAIGDVQGCYVELCGLLEKIGFDGSRDRLWFLGDLVNRGPASLEVLRLVRSLGDAAVTVLGNHDLHLLAIHIGGHKLTRSDTFSDVLAADDIGDIADWLRQQPLLVRDDELGYVMVHAGIPHIWSLEKAELLARELETIVRGDCHVAFFATMYGNKPDLWNDNLVGMDRWRAITNYLTRMRLIDERGRLDFSHKGAVDDAPPEWIPWYEMRADNPLRLKLLFGHWAAIEGQTSSDDILALDTGCVWGRELTAICLESGEFIRVLSAKQANPYA